MRTYMVPTVILRYHVNMDRTIKQLIIGTIFLVLIGVVGFGIYRIFFPAPTCSDGIQNQTEEGVDCGAICGKLCAPAVQTLQLQLTQAVSLGMDKYDIVVQVRNPNGIYGSSRVPYTISVQPADGSAVQQFSGTFYIMPGQSRFLIEPSVHASGGMPTIQFQLGEPTWGQVDEKPLEVTFPIKRESYKIGTSHDYEAIVLNDSNYDFQTVDIAVVVSDTVGTVVAVNRTNVNTMSAHEERYFKVSWPSPVPSNTANIRVEATTDLFANDNFLKTHGVHEPFQEFR